MTVGLTEGWWRFSDLDLRPAYALLSRSDWKELLGRCGFAEAVAVPDGDAANGITAQQVVMVARADGATATSGKEAGAMSVAGRWLILADQGASARPSPLRCAPGAERPSAWGTGLHTARRRMDA